MIILKNISKSYGGKAVLDNVNIEIPGSGVSAFSARRVRVKRPLSACSAGLRSPTAAK